MSNPGKPIELASFVEDWSPQPVETRDVVQRERLVQLARSLDLDESQYSIADTPIVGHWTAFQEWPASAELGPDGHPARGAFYPPIPDRRRMFAGATVTAHEPMLVGVDTVRRTSLESVTPKVGRTGAMIFVVTRDEYIQADRLCRTEMRNVVYRSGSDGTGRALVRGKTRPGPSADATWASNWSVPSSTLFRFSALTANAHRIHYDAPYATEVEGYPALVVHGPLLATLMADAVGRAWGNAAIGKFSFRLQHPVYVDDMLVVEGVSRSGGADLTVTTAAGTAATATAVRA